MLRGLVSASPLLPRAGGGAIAPEHIEAVTAERDFFRDKYAKQIDEMELLKNQLRDSQRVINRLRGEILELQGEQARGAEGRGRSPKATKPAGGDSTDTSVTCPTDDDERTAKSAGERDPELLTDAHDVTAAADPAETAEKEEDNPADDDSSGASEGEGIVFGSDEDRENDDEEENNEAEDIRANAARMLLWANYQTSKRATPNTSLVGDSLHDDDSRADNSFSTPSKRGASDAIVSELPAALDRAGPDCDDSLDSSSRCRPARSVGSWRSGSNSSPRTSGSKIGKLLYNLADMIDPQGESETSEDESVGEE